MYQDSQFVILNNTSDTIIFHFSELSYFDLKDSIIICNPYSENIFDSANITYAKNNPCHPYIEEKTDLIITATTSSDRILIKDIKKNAN